MMNDVTSAYVVNIVGFAGAALLLRALAARTGDWLSFAHVFSFVWTVNLLVAQLALNGRLRPEVPTLIVLFGAWWMFLAGAWWTTRTWTVSAQPTQGIEKVNGIAVLVALVALQVIAFTFEVGRQQLSVAALLGNLWRTGVELRLDDVYSVGEYPFTFSIWRWDHVLYIPLAMYLHANRLISAKSVAAILGLAVVMAFGRYTRAPVLQVAVISLVCWLALYRPRARTKWIVAGAVTAVVLAAFVVSQLNLTAAYTNDEASVESVFAYIGGSPLAYQALLRGDVPHDVAGLYSLDALNYVLFKLSVVQQYGGVIRPYVDAALGTNIYTFLDAYTMDGGIAGALFGAFLTGGVVAFVFNRARTRPTYGNLTFYAYLTYCCAMAVANNEFIRTGVFINAGLAWLIGRLIHARPLTARRSVPLVQDQATS